MRNSESPGPALSLRGQLRSQCDSGGRILPAPNQIEGMCRELCRNAPGRPGGDQKAAVARKSRAVAGGDQVARRPSARYQRQHVISNPCASAKGAEPVLLTFTVLPCPRLWPEGQIREERCGPGGSTDGRVTKSSGAKGQIQSVWPDCDRSLLTVFPASVFL